jgi:hypothetical protein
MALLVFSYQVSQSSTASYYCTQNKELWLLNDTQIHSYWSAFDETSTKYSVPARVYGQAKIHSKSNVGTQIKILRIFPDLTAPNTPVTHN